MIATLTEHPLISVVVGAGHAYKFAALIGGILRDRALDGHTSHPIEPFRLERPAITGPAFEKAFHV